MTVPEGLARRLRTATPPTADCVVIGGGVVGAASAFYAARAGLSTVLLEKRSTLCTLTTPASAGGFRAQFEDPDEIALMRSSIDIFERFAEHIGVPGWDIGLRQQGYLWVTTRSDGVDRHLERVGRQRAGGLDDVELLSGDEARRRFGFLSPDVVSARFRQRDGWLDPKRLTVGFAVASGAMLCVDVEVLGFETAGGRVTAVRTSRGAIATGSVVLAAGPFSGRLASLAGLDLPLSLRTRHKLVFPELGDVPPDAPMTIDEDTGTHFRPEGRGALLLRPHAEAAAPLPLDDVPGSTSFAIDLLSPDGPCSAARFAPLWRAVWARGTDAWWVVSGQYTETPDRKPWLGPSELGGLHLNVGYSGHGVMGSAAGSRLVVDLLVGRIAPGDNPFRPHRATQTAALGPL